MIRSRALGISSILFSLLVGSLCLGAEEPQVQLDSLRRNFQKTEEFDTKMKILEDSVKVGSASMGPLYHLAVDYVITHRELFRTESRARELAQIAVEQIGIGGYAEANDSLWQLFELTDKEPILQRSILKSLGVVGDSQAVRNLAAWLDDQNKLFQAGNQPDLQLIGEAVNSLGALGDNQGFSALFTALQLDYSDNISAQARQGLLDMAGELKDNLQRIVQKASASEKLAALNMALEEPSLTVIQKAELAEYALETALLVSSTDPQEQALLRQMRHDAMAALGERKWAKAADLAIEHFNQALLEYDRKHVDKGYLLDAIRGLAEMGTHESAVRLTLYLELLNSYTEYGRVSDEQIVLALIENLGLLGDKVAFDDLSLVTYLKYSNRVIRAAKDAIDKLKW